MNNWKSSVSMVLGAACLVLALLVIWTGRTTRQMQMELQQMQGEINNGLLGQAGSQLGQSILRDMANLSLNDQRMHKLLADNGYTINVNQPAGGNAAETAPKTTRKIP